MEESITSKEYEIQEVLELECPEIFGVLSVIKISESEVEAKLDQVGKIIGFGFSGGFCCGHDGVDNAKEGGLVSLGRWVLDDVVFKMTGELFIHYSVGLGVWVFLGLGRLSRRWVVAITPHS